MTGTDEINVLGAIADMRASFLRTTGKPPARIKVGHEFLMKLADETHGCLRQPPGEAPMTVGEHRRHVLESAKRGELRVYGMQLEYQAPFPMLDVAAAQLKGANAAMADNLDRELLQPVGREHG